MARSWRNLLLSVGDSLLEIVRAETSALRADLAESGRRFSVALGLGVLAAFLLFWAVGAAAFAIFQILTLWLSGWVSALAVLTLFVALAMIIGLLARHRWLAIELPGETVRRRVDEHVTWWTESFLAEGDQQGGPSLTVGQDDESE